MNCSRFWSPCSPQVVKASLGEDECRPGTTVSRGHLVVEAYVTQQLSAYATSCCQPNHANESQPPSGAEGAPISHPPRAGAGYRAGSRYRCSPVRVAPIARLGREARSPCVASLLRMRVQCGFLRRFCEKTQRDQGVGTRCQRGVAGSRPSFARLAQSGRSPPASPVSCSRKSERPRPVRSGAFSFGVVGRCDI
jgi:hypothetical protein